MSQEYATTAILPEQQTLRGSGRIHRSLVSDKKIEKVKSRYAYRVLKRSFDVVASLCGLLLLSPVFVIIAIAVYICDPGPVFYQHERLGKNGKRIKIWKFRSMCVNSEEVFESFTEEQKEIYFREFKLENDPRITTVGKFLRKSSLDELPQLLNVLKGDLSLIGPRPIVQEELEKYGENADLLLSVRPGITGYWQANGRNLINYENGRKEMELYYVTHCGVWMDIKILFQTVVAVVSRKGAE